MYSDVEERSEGALRWRRSRILNAPVDNLSVDNVLDLLDRGGVFFTINPEHLYQLQRNADFADAYANADYVSCDSLYVFGALRLLGRGLDYRASGSDIVPAYWKRHAANPDVKIFLLGAKSGIAQRALERINAAAGRSVVVGALSPSFDFVDDPKETEGAIIAINASGATCLVVGLGAPKQEIWIHRNRARMPSVKAFIGVGATIDYEADAVKRAPQWMRSNGLEWVYRVVSEPRRYFKRYARNTEFVWLALLDRVGLYRPPSFAERKASRIGGGPDAGV